MYMEYEIFPNRKDVDILLDWFAIHKRVYPWSRQGESPYAIWISEVMLQQTTVSTVIPRYKHWMEKFPDLKSLAEASQDDVLREWEGLGYYSRARNLHSAAREAHIRYGGKLPREVEELRSLPGVGEYIAAAVASFAFGERAVAVDANVRRIVQRIMASEVWTSELEQLFKDLALSNMPTDCPGVLNATLMQFGQLICLPRNPDCEVCPLRKRCVSNSLNLQEKIPVRRSVKIIRKTTEIAILCVEGKVWLQQRIAGIGAGLWCFPALKELITPNEWIPFKRLEKRIHTYTHFRDELIPCLYRRKDTNTSNPTENGIWTSIRALGNFGMPSAYRIIANNLKEFVYSGIIPT